MKKWVLGFLGCLFLLSVAQAGIVNVPLNCIRSWNDDSNQLAFICTGPTAVYLYKDTSADNLYAPVYLPDGAIIKNIRVMYMDNDASGDVYAILFRSNMYTGTRDTLLQVQSSGASSAIQNMVGSTCTPPSLRLVNNAACQYFLRLYFTSFGTDLRIYGVAIEYQ
jgi:hypothetical protein